jgi:hypothetical protein
MGAKSMTDQELDLLLAAWKIAGPSDKLRERTLAGLRVKERRHWPRFGRSLVWAAAAAVVLVCIEAFAQTIRSAQVPFLVESELTTYSSDGTVRARLHTRSVTENTRERMLSLTIDGDAYGTLLLDAKEDVHSLLQPVNRLARFLIVGPQEADPTRADARIAVCGEPSCRTLGDWTMPIDRSTCRNDLFAGEETILNHRTVGLQRESPGGLRLTAWLAPDLGCFPLKVLIEQRNPDGSFNVRERREPLKVTMNPKQDFSRW